MLAFSYGNNFSFKLEWLLSAEAAGPLKCDIVLYCGRVYCLLSARMTVHVEDVLNINADAQIRNESCSLRCINTTSASFRAAEARAISTESSVQHNMKSSVLLGQKSMCKTAAA